MKYLCLQSFDFLSNK